MQKKAILALMLVCTLLLSSCTLIQKDPEVDKARVIIDVAGTQFTKAQVQSQVTSYQNYMGNMYAQYGMSYDAKAMLSSDQDTVIDQLVEKAVKDAKVTELGVSLTDEEIAEIDEEFQGYRDMFRGLVTGEDTEDMTEEEINAMIDQYIYMYYGVTRDGMVDDALMDKLEETVVADVAEPTAEAIQTAFDEKVANAKTSYESNLSSYGNAVNSASGGSTIYYRPAGYRLVKQILVQYDDEHDTIISTLNDRVTAQDTIITEAETALTEAGV